MRMVPCYAERRDVINHCVIFSNPMSGSCSLAEATVPTWAGPADDAGPAAAWPPFDRGPIRVLLVEADEEAFRTTRALLSAAPHLQFTIEWVRGLETGRAALRAGGVDICLVEQALPDGDGLELARFAAERGCRAPIIMLAGASTLELDLRAMALGVADLLDKKRLDPTGLGRTVRYALARQRHADRLSRLAQYDELTGLANRSLFQDRLEHALAWARRHDRLVAVMILDLNGFKAVNDRLGHVAGDRLLAIVAQRLTGRLRETDTVARLGGDEFAILIENLAKPEHAALVARKLLDTVAPPATVDGEEVMVTASLGVAVYPRDGQDGAQLVREADRAMYRAKAEGGNLCRFASDQLERRVQRGALLETDLRRGLEQGEFTLHYQPQVTLTPGALGIAAQLRWRHPQLGPIGPERFLSLAEDNGLLEALTDWLFEAACGQARSWRDQGLARMHLALPLLSRQQLAWSGLSARLGASLRAAGLTAGSLEIELREELLLNDADAGGHALAALKELGVRVALDGYGSGSTALRSLQLGVLDTLKLARELHQDVPADTRRSAVVAAIVALARELGLRVVAEGIDRQEQLASLRRYGCDAVQAFMSCPPLPAEACTGWLRQASARVAGSHDPAPAWVEAVRSAAPDPRAIPEAEPALASAAGEAG
ncbi:MAG TPA: EAL domain-containing protein [Geminicoccaceae bacterium]|nr:EAL domain-containing protein [Geminicoccaceae bacterium]